MEGVPDFNLVANLSAQCYCVCHLRTVCNKNCTLLTSMPPPKILPFHSSQSPASLHRGCGVASPLMLRRVPKRSSCRSPPATGIHTSCKWSGPRLFSLRRRAAWKVSYHISQTVLYHLLNNNFSMICVAVV